MEFDIGNLFYIIITIVVIAVGLLGKRKKPAQQGSDGSAAEKRPGFFENLERILNQEEGSREYVEMEVADHEIMEEEAPLHVAEEEPEKAGLLEEYERVMMRMETSRGESITEMESDINTEPLEVIHLDEDGGTDYFEVVAEFNAATAVVYSAIINRIDY